MSNPAKKPRTNRFGITAPVSLRTNASSGAGLIDREQRAAIAEAERFLKQNRHAIEEMLRTAEQNREAIDAAAQAVKQNQDAIDPARRLAEQYQIPIDEAEAIAKAQRMVEKHQKAFDLLR